MNAEIGSRIRTLRRALDLSQDQLAEILDISASYLGLVERGQRCFGLAKLVKLRGVFNVSLDYLVVGCEGEFNHNKFLSSASTGFNAINGESQAFADVIRDAALFNFSNGEIELLEQAIRLQMNIVVRARALGRGSA